MPSLATINFCIDLPGKVLDSVLGHNTDGKYIVTSNKHAFKCELTPRKVNVWIEKSRDGRITPIVDVEVREIACGINHTVCTGYCIVFLPKLELRVFEKKFTFKGSYLNFSHLTKCITEMYMKKQYKSSITKNNKFKKISFFDGVPLKGYVAS